MRDTVLTYREMCDAESVQTLQRGMNYRLSITYSVLLMSQRSNAPYQDEILDDGETVVYEGHDVPKTRDVADPKLLDQPYYTKHEKLTQNGKFAEAIKRSKLAEPVEKVKIYEKLFDGVWSFRGFFDLIDYEYVTIGQRRVFRFILKLCQDPEDVSDNQLKERTRIIPTEIKKQVWVRDGGKCVICGASDELHFDHNIPYSKGGSSITAENVRILCARHNLQKGVKIE